MSKASMYFTVSNLSGKHDIKEVKRSLASLPGVLDSAVSDDTDAIAVDFDTTGVSPGQLERCLEGLGYEITTSRVENHIM